MKADPKADAAPKSSKKMLIIILAAVLALGLGGAAAWFFTQGKSDGQKEVKKAEKPEFVVIEPFTVNLQPEDGEQYLQIQFTLQVSSVEQVELIKTNMPHVRNRMLLLLSGKKASEISTVEGKKQLSKEIIEAVKQPFFDKGPPQEVSDVMFTSFIIQ
ncbi:flagellar basal body-associated protein FliL [Massilia sp. PAMC28688]|uniref:flagellar basal body-associated protein FliL n=1 Tax=Massilia sp. PAMC28688 TaxID=2861283 RepID=UPI001C637B3A|nr:flagellar basal body-associated protein FliL [Massilia sp. PAMC28688]QYF92026.1 flagellar basal body-associated protein FliL [Massilia sp. PAMC28688]